MDDFLISTEDSEEAPVVPVASPDPEQEEENLIEEEVEEQLIDDPSVSGNELYQKEVLDLLKGMKGDLEDVKRSNDRFLQESHNVSFSDSLSSDDVSDDQTVYVSSNIITKPINDYSVTEALLLFEVVSIVSVVLFLVIRKAVFKWR